MNIETAENTGMVAQFKQVETAFLGNQKLTTNGGKGQHKPLEKGELRGERKGYT